MNDSQNTGSWQGRRNKLLACLLRYQEHRMAERLAAWGRGSIWNGFLARLGFFTPMDVILFAAGAALVAFSCLCVEPAKHEHPRFYLWVAAIFCLLSVKFYFQTHAPLLRAALWLLSRRESLAASISYDKIPRRWQLRPRDWRILLEEVQDTSGEPKGPNEILERLMYRHPIISWIVTCGVLLFLVFYLRPLWTPFFLGMCLMAAHLGFIRTRLGALGKTLLAEAPIVGRPEIKNARGQGIRDLVIAILLIGLGLVVTWEADKHLRAEHTRAKAPHVGTP